jgi:hypothetical protein
LLTSCTIEVGLSLSRSITPNKITTFQFFRRVGGPLCVFPTFRLYQYLVLSSLVWQSKKGKHRFDQGKQPVHRPLCHGLIHKARTCICISKMTTITSQVVLDHYSALARENPTKNADHIKKVAESFGYSAQDLAGIPEEANLGVSCGNPFAVAGLKAVRPLSPSLPLFQPFASNSRWQ